MRKWFLKYNALIILHAASIVLLFVSFGIFYFNRAQIVPPLILHFDSFGGVDLFGDFSDVLGMWFVGAVSVAANIFLGRAFFYRERIISYIFAGTNIFLSSLLLIAMTVIILANI